MARPDKATASAHIARAGLDRRGGRVREDPGMPGASSRRRDLVVLGVALALTGPALLFLGSVQSSEVPTVEQLLPAPRAARIRALRGRFGADADLLLVLFRAASGGTAGRVTEIERVLAGVPGVAHVFSPVTRPRLALSKTSEGSQPRLIVTTGPLGGTPPTPLDRFLAPHDNEAIFVVTLGAPGATLSGARQIVDDLGVRLSQAMGPGDVFHLAGFPAQRVQTWTEARRDVGRMLPWLIVAALVVPWLFFRSLWAAVFPLVMAALAATATVLGYRLIMGAVHPFVLVLLPLVWTIATMDTLHLLECTARRRAAGDPDPVAGAARELGLPCLVTAVVTAASLLCMAVPGGPPLLRLFGVWGAVGTVLAYLLSFVVGGPLLRIAGAVRLPPEMSGRLARRLIAASFRRPVAIIAAWTIVVVASGVGASRLRFESSYTDAFVSDHPFARDLAALRAATGSDLAPVEIYIEADGARRDDPRALLFATISLEQYLRTLPETKLSLSAATLAIEFLRDEPRARAYLRALREPAEARARAAEMGRDPRLGPWIDLAHGTTRTLVLLAPSSPARRAEIVAWIDHFGRTMLDGFALNFGGVGYLYQAAELEARTGLLWGMAGDVALLVLALGIALRRPRAVLAGLLGNVVPVIVLVGLMAATGTPWSLGLLGLPIIVVGLAADDTVHLLWPARRRERPFATSLSLAYRRFGSAAVGTSFLVAACLACLFASDFRASRALGWLFPAGILLALGAELTLVPALLAARRRRANPNQIDTRG